MKKIILAILLIIIIIFIIFIALISIPLYKPVKEITDALDEAEENPIVIDDTIIIPEAVPLEGPQNDAFNNIGWNKFTGSIKNIRYEVSLPSETVRRLQVDNSFSLNGEAYGIGPPYFSVGNVLDDSWTLDYSYKLLKGSESRRLSIIKPIEIKIVDFKDKDALYNAKMIRDAYSVEISLYQVCGTGFAFSCSVETENEFENLCPLIFESFSYNCI